jgi:RNA 3'-terminal phosphate cyclase (ATP)
MLVIDGSSGEGGGQILRTSLALSLITQTPFRIEAIRARREKPGLMRQHLTAVTSAAAIGRADVQGAHIGSTGLTFHPGPVTPGKYHFPIGTAGSTMLVLQTVLPPLLTARGPSVLTLEGGTHNRHAPPFDFIQRVFLPLINRMGPRITARLERHGFYPAGGGRIIVEIEPSPRLTPLVLVDRGPITARCARALVFKLPRHIAERELQIVREGLGWDPADLHIVHPPEAAGPGNAVMIEIASEHITELFSAIGEVGKSAEAVAHEAVEEARAYLAAGVAAGPYLADQLLLPMALAGGGSMTTLPLTTHSISNAETIGRFLGITLEAAEDGPAARVSLRQK